MKKIRIRTDCNERGRIYYYRDFAVVTEIPKVGEEYEAWPAANGSVSFF